MSDLGKIEKKAKAYAKAREELAGTVKELDEQTSRLRRQYTPTIRSQAEVAANRRRELEAAVADAPQAFQSPKTMTLHGVKVGFQKSKGRVVVEDADHVVALIRKQLPDRFDQLVKVDEKPIKSALNQLSAAELRKIGCTITEVGEQVIVKPTDSEIDKLVDALLADEDPAAASDQTTTDAA